MMAAGGDREPEKVLVIGGLGAKASTAWCAHIVQHLVGLRGAQGQSLACVCTYDLRWGPEIDACHPIVWQLRLPAAVHAPWGA